MNELYFTRCPSFKNGFFPLVRGEPCFVVLTIKLLTNDAEIFLWKQYKKMKWI